MKKQLCCECQKKRERCKPTVMHVDGSIDVVCPKCWRELGYSTIIVHKPEESFAAYAGRKAGENIGSKINGPIGII